MAESLESFIKNWDERTREVFTNPANTKVGQVFKQFADDTIEAAQKVLAEENRNATDTLSNSLTPVVEIDGSKYTLSILAEDYWDYNDSGVDGLVSKWGSPYSFKFPNPSKAHVDAMLGVDKRNWLGARGINQLQSKQEDGSIKVKNLITDKDYRGAAYALAKGTKKNGIKPTYFLSSQLTDEKLNQLTDDLADAFINSF